MRVELPHSNGHAILKSRYNSKMRRETEKILLKDLGMVPGQDMIDTTINILSLKESQHFSTIQLLREIHVDGQKVENVEEGLDNIDSRDYDTLIAACSKIINPIVEEEKK